MSRIPPLGISFIAITMAGCSPQCNIGGAYFPAWLACLLAGLAGTWGLHVAAVRMGFFPYLRPLRVVYCCAFTAIASAVWLIFFAL